MPKYYTIDEAAAKRAKDMNSFSDYKPGSATAEYRKWWIGPMPLGNSKKGVSIPCTMKR